MVIPARTLLVPSLLTLLTTVVGGCYTTEDSFIRRISKLGCVRIKECIGAAFEQEFDGDMGECRDTLEDEAHDIFDQGDALGCEYNDEEGRDCVHAAYRNRKDCSDGAGEEIVDACMNVPDCGARLQRDDGEPPTSVGTSLRAVAEP